MRKFFSVIACLTMAACGSDSDTSTPTPPLEVPELSVDQCYIMSTTKGNMVLAIDLTNVPITGQNFQQYVDTGFYADTLFHRAVNNFVIQGGGFTSGLVPKTTNAPIKNEASVGFSNLRGTIAMARTNASDSATSQFFINVLDNTQLDASADQAGYAVFGQVIDGMEIADQISIVDTRSFNSLSNVPVDDIVIQSVEETDCNAY